MPSFSENILNSFEFILKSFENDKHLEYIASNLVQNKDIVHRFYKVYIDTMPSIIELSKEASAITKNDEEKMFFIAGAQQYEEAFKKFKEEFHEEFGPLKKEIKQQPVVKEWAKEYSFYKDLLTSKDMLGFLVAMMSVAYLIRIFLKNLTKGMNRNFISQKIFESDITLNSIKYFIDDQTLIFDNDTFNKYKNIFEKITKIELEIYNYIFTGYIG